MNPRYFRAQDAFRRWLQKHHGSASELWIRFYRVAADKGGLSYRQAVDEALCFGWIDGLRKRFDDQSYVQRFTPRKAKSYWSAVNTARVLELSAAGLMHESGLAAFERRDRATDKYSFERPTAALDPAAEKRFRADGKAWAFFDAQAPWYRRVAIHWVTSAKREATRQRRLDTLIRDSTAGRRIGLVPSAKKKEPR